MTPNNEIEVYFHMRNHYKRLKHVKSVVDSSAPKGRSRKKSKSPKRSSAKRKSPSRPPTRRNPKDMPIKSSHPSREVSPQDHHYKTDPIIKSKTSEVIDTFGCDQHEYLQFSLRITEDIIKNDLYTNEQMRQVLNSHYEANKGRLSNDKMMTTMSELCKELNIPFSECSPTTAGKLCERPINICVCDSKQVQTIITVNGTAENENKEGKASVEEELLGENTFDQISKMPSEEINKSNLIIREATASKLLAKEATTSKLTTKELAASKMSIKEATTSRVTIKEETEEKDQAIQKCMCGSPSCDSILCDVVSNTDNKQATNKQLESSMKIAPDEKEEKEPEKQQEELIAIKLEEEELVSDAKCHCGNECCDRDRLFIFLDHYEKRLAHPKNIHEFGVSHYMTYIEPKKPCTTELSIQTSQHNMSSKQKNVEPKEAGIDYLKEPNEPFLVDKMCGPCKEKGIVKYSYGESNKSKGVDKSCSTYKQKEIVRNHYERQKSSVVDKKCTCKEREFGKFNYESPNEQSDFIVFEGPVLIPKSTLHSVEGLGKPCKNTECVSNYYSQPRVEYVHSLVQFSGQNCATKTTSSVSTEFMSNMVPEPQKYEYTKKTDVLYQKNYDYDLTPQKDTLLYENNVKCERTPCGCKTNRNSNLLLGGHYDKIKCVEEIESNKYTKFYPSIATQVTSMELLSNPLKKPLEIPEHTRQITTQQVVLNVPPTVPTDAAAVRSENIIEKKAYSKTGMSSQNVNQNGQIGNDDLFKSLDAVPQVCSTDSMDQRIDMLRSEIQKYRETGEDNTNVTNSDNNSNDEEEEDGHDFKTTDAAIGGSSKQKVPKVSISHQ